MGNCDCQMKEDEEGKLVKGDFKFLYPIGKGGFGRVWKVEHRKSENNKIYAMKQMSKLIIYEKKSIQPILSELSFLTVLYHPFLSNMHFAFQDYGNLYIVMDYLGGGDLRYHINRSRRFSEEQTKFVIACIIISLEYINSHQIMHRDIKPENLVFDSQGYLHLTDFGIAKEYRFGDCIIDSSGTPGYMAPEVINNKPHEFCVDYFALGVIAFELMLERRPYAAKTRKEIKEEMFSTNIALKESNLPQGWNSNAIDFINGLLKRKKAQRLGYFGIKDIKEHPWISSMKWNQIQLKEYPSPFRLSKGDNFDSSYANKKDQVDELDRDYYLHKMNANQFFKDFYFDSTLIKKPTVTRTDRTSHFESGSTNPHDRRPSNLETIERDKKEKVRQIKVKRSKMTLPEVEEIVI